MPAPGPFDVVVLGTGAAGLTAALAAHSGGASVGLFEKADQVGGTSAWSGGMVWIPANHHAAELGVSDSRDEALTYLHSLSHGLIDEKLVAAFVDTGPDMVRWLEAETPVVFTVVEGFPDYHPEHPGGKPGGGRSLECPLFAFDELGAWAERVTIGPQMGRNITMSETPLGRGAPGGVPPEEMARRQIHDERGAGQGLVGRLLKGCLDRGMEPITGAAARDLVVDGGKVVGVRFESADGGSFEVVARRGVVLATGGFEWDRELVRAFVRGPMTHPVSVRTNTGDGLRMAMRIGASLSCMPEAWWVPTIEVPMEGFGTVAWQVNGERTRPHCIMVNQRGERFTNEAANYNAFGEAFHVVDVSSYEFVNHPAWMVFDHHYLSRYGLARYTPDAGPTPSWMVEAPSLEELAAAIDVPEDALVATVDRWNDQTARGHDDDFGRGGSAHDRWWGDPAAGDDVLATMGPIDTAPYYAVQVHSGALGTKGGPRTDVDARVLDVDGQPIPGLYAAGNAMGSVLGMTYGGAGGTLGPAMVFGFLAGRHAAARGAGPEVESV
jgi:succinate dehydrogenase/fumarate reductase flavoprotein subunit